MVTILPLGRHMYRRKRTIIKTRSS